MTGSLNTIYRVIWSRVTNAWVVVSEISKSKGKKSSLDTVEKNTQDGVQLAAVNRLKYFTSLALSFSALTMSATVQALPTGAENVVGNLTTVTNGNNLSIYQHTQKSIANWQSFNIDHGESVNLYQPTNGMALYRILGNNATQIYGQLNATGKLFLINPNGIIFGETAQVDVGSIVASSLNIKNQDFLNNRFVFSGGAQYGNVINKGTIRAGNEGYIVLLGQEVDNSGTLTASRGSVVLGSASRAVLDFYGNGLVQAKLSGDAVNAKISHSGTIDADGGVVQMATRARSAAINITGIVEASQLVERDGLIRLEAGSTGTVTVAGTLDVSGQGTKGGTVKVLGDQVALLDGSVIDASGTHGGGTVLIGGNYQGLGPEQNASATFVAQGATIDASATEAGNGGKVIVWGTDYMHMHGQINATGGATSGNGGFVETSSHGEFAVTSAPNVGAFNGTAGTWLIDPLNLVIDNNANNNVSAATPFTSTGAGASISWATIDAGLASGNVVVTTVGTVGVESGNITVADAGVLNNGNNLTISADGKLDFNSSLTRNAAGDVTLTANNDITINDSISLTGGSSDLIIKSNNGSVDANVDLVTKGGEVNIQAANAIDFNNIITTFSPGAGPGVTTVSGRVVLVASSGNVTGGNITTTGSANGGGGAVSIQSGGAVTVADVNTSAGALNFNTDGRSAGNVSIAGVGVVSAGNITANGSNAAGTNKNGGNSGEVLVLSKAGVNLNNISSVSGTGTGTGNTGANRDVSLKTTTNPGAIHVGGNIVTSGGNVTVTAQAGGNITLNNVNTTTHNPTNAATTLVSGKVEAITSNGSITAGNIDTSGSSNGGGGAVSMQAAVGGITTGSIDSSAGSVIANIDGRNAGNVNLIATSAVNVSDISAVGSNGLGAGSKGGNSGEVSIRSINNTVTFNKIDSSSGTGLAGSGLGRTVTVRAGQDVVMNGDITSSSNANPTAVSQPAVLIVAGRDFNNASNSDIIFNAGATGSWLIYSSNPNNVNDVRGTPLEASYGFKEYNRSYAAFDVPTGTNNGIKNGFIYSEPQFINVVLSGTTSKPFDGNANVTNTAGLSLTTTLTDGDVITTPPTVSNLTYNNPLIGVGKPVNGTFTVDTTATDGAGRPVYGYQATTNSVATGTIFAGAFSPRNDSGLGTNLSSLNLFNGLTVQALNPAAGDDDPDYIPCPENNDRIGRNPVLNSGVKLPNEVIATCI